MIETGHMHNFFSTDYLYHSSRSNKFYYLIQEKISSVAEFAIAAPVCTIMIT